MRIYVACLAAYNNGCLHGRWINATGDVDEMQEEVDAILAGSPVEGAEEFAIHDFDGIPSSLGEYCGLQAVADYVDFVEAVEDQCGDHEGLAQAMIDNWHDAGSARDELDNFAGVYDSFRGYADDAADEMIACHSANGKVPDMLTNYFDYEAWARDLALEMTVLDIPGGVAVFHP